MVIPWEFLPMFFIMNTMWYGRKALCTWYILYMYAYMYMLAVHIDSSLMGLLLLRCCRTILVFDNRNSASSVKTAQKAVFCPA